MRFLAGAVYLRSKRARERPGIGGLLLFPQPQACPAAILLDELDAGGLKGLLDGVESSRQGQNRSGLSFNALDRFERNLSQFGQLGLLHPQHGARSANLLAREDHFATFLSLTPAPRRARR